LLAVCTTGADGFTCGIKASAPSWRPEPSASAPVERLSHRTSPSWSKAVANAYERLCQRNVRWNSAAPQGHAACAGLATSAISAAGSCRLRPASPLPQRTANNRLSAATTDAAPPGPTSSWTAAVADGAAPASAGSASGFHTRCARTRITLVSRASNDAL
jgi:hypothetical protein